MKINDIPDVFASKIRLAILTSLIGGPRSFGELKKIAQATDGNLSVHLSRLEADGYIGVQKSFSGRKPLSVYSLSDKGRSELLEYIRLLNRLLG